MKIKNFFLLPFLFLSQQKARSWMTIIGVVISVALIFVILSLSYSFEESIITVFEEFGTNHLYISPSLSFNTNAVYDENFNLKLLDDVKKIKGVDDAIGLAYNKGYVSYKNQDSFVNVLGLYADDLKKVEKAYLYDKNLLEGRFFNKDEKGSVIVGYNVVYSDKFFDKTPTVKKTILIEGEPFKIIGVYKQLGTADDDNVYILYDDYKRLYDVTDRIDFIDVLVKKEVNPLSLKEPFERFLDKKLGENNYVLLTPENIIKSFSNTIGIINLVLFFIALISFVVSVVGIINTMFTVVVEREKTISIFRSVGFTKKIVALLLMIESGFIALAGGILGIILGFFLFKIVILASHKTGVTFLESHIPYMSILYLLIASFIVGLLSGVLPAILASKNNIIEGLRKL